MCGGRGTRLGGDTEKPLVRIRGRAMVDRVVDAAMDATRVGTVYAVASLHATETRAHLAESRPGVPIVTAPGDGYVSDLQYAVDAIGTDGSTGPTLLTLAADLPLLDGEAVDAVVDTACDADAASLTVCVPAERKRELGVSADTATEIDGREVVPAGINVVGSDETEGDDADGTGSDTADETGGDVVHLTDDTRLAVNVNYPSDALIAERLLAKTTHTDS